MKKLYFPILAVILLTSIPQYSKRGNHNNSSPHAQLSISKGYSTFNINNLSTWMRNNGESDYSLNETAGLEFPKFSDKHVIYESGFVWGVKFDGEIRVGGSTYQQGLLPGRILADGTREDETSSTARMYRVRRDWKGGSYFAEEYLGEGTAAEIYNRYDQDWNEWPAEFGAPFSDVNRDGKYDPAIDIPGVPGADQTLWYVANDLDTAQSIQFYGSNPIGFEIQVTTWGYNVSGPLANTLFRKMKVVNRSGHILTDAYFAYWMDADVGGAGDDFVGCDTLLSLGFAYNGMPTDDEYGNQPPAVGVNLISGPVVDGEPSDTAIYDFGKLSGMKNLSMTAHAFFINVDPVYTDPQLGSYSEGAIRMYNLLQGKVATTGIQFTDPSNGVSTKFALSGDPVAGTGWIDGMLHAPGDRRNLMSSGPFTIAVGDTQEMTVAVTAAQGSDRLGSIKKLKNYTKHLRKNYLSGEVLNISAAPIPPNPEFTVSVEGKNIFLTIDSLAQNTLDLLNFDESGYKFQGFNIYQESFDPLTSQSKEYTFEKIFTVDIADSIDIIFDEVYDFENDIYIKNQMLQNGSNSGLKYKFVISSDISNNSGFISGKTYAFGLTAYTFGSTDSLTKSTESSMTTRSILFTDKNLTAQYGDTLTVIHSNGESGAEVTALIFDPGALTGDDYKLVFNDGPDITGSLQNLTTNEVVIDSSANMSGDFTSPLAEGMQIRVVSSFTYTDFLVTENANGVIDGGAGAAADYLGFPGLGRTNIGNQQISGARWLFDYVPTTGVTMSFDDFVARTSQYSGGFGSMDQGMRALCPDDYEFRFSQTGGKAYFNWNDSKGGDSAFVGAVPFEVWNVGTMEDSSDDFQMFPFVLDGDADGTFNLKPADSEISSRSDDPLTDFMYLLEPLNDSSAHAGYDTLVSYYESVAPASQQDWALGKVLSLPSMMRIGFSSWNGGDVNDPNWPDNVAAIMPEVGTIFKIVTSKTPAPGVDEFIVTQPDSITSADEIIAERFRLYQNFPNPFNPSTVIKFSLPASAQVKLRVYNSLGQRVAEMLNTQLQCGVHSV